MQCKNHPDVSAFDNCAGCAQPYCAFCLLVIAGKRYCSECVPAARKEHPIVEESRPCELADEALKCAITGVFFFGFVVGVVAIYKAIKAREIIAYNPHLTGSGKAIAAIVIGVFAIVVWVLAFILKITHPWSA
ncbi:MAG: DUF4190 domain-containing protein [Verrucomicrobiia bacterium]|jgi:hypothetical protein